MNNIRIGLLAIFLMSTIAHAQDKKEVLLTIDNTPVYASEFKRVYKKNLELVQDESQKTVAGYLDLFIDYKLKVKEAQDQKLDKKKLYIQEFEKYQEQLSRYYIYEDNVTSDLALEAYNRGKEEINAAHLLIKISFADSPSDTLNAYKKIEDLRTRAVSGENFSDLIKQFSEEPNAASTGGKLGYFSVFSLVYPFETASYNTAVGEISDIVRTRYGYHIIKVNDRRERMPKRTVSHIMISDKTNDTRTFNPEERINEIYQLLQQGQIFEDLAKQYSEDKGSAKLGGQLRPIGKGEISAKKFDEVVFTLGATGDISKPFKSSVGWHIARLDSIHNVTSFEQEKERLTKRVKDGSRSKIVTAAVKNQIMNKYGFKKGAPYIEYFKSHINEEDLLRARWKYIPVPEADNKVVFTIGDRKVYFSELASYIGNKQIRSTPFKNMGAALVTLYDEFEADMVKKYYKDKLEEEDPEYAGVISEYRDGLLIFDLMQTNVWNKAKTDTVASKAFYEANKQRYTWANRVDAIVVNASEKSVAKKAKKLLEQNKTPEAIKAALNTEEKINVIVSAGKFEEGAKDLPKDFTMKMGVSETFTEENRYTVVKVLEVIPPATKLYEEVRGRVMTQYQEVLEAKLMKDLRNKYTVEVNTKTLKKIKKELDK